MGVGGRLAKSVKVQRFSDSAASRQALLRRVVARRVSPAQLDIILGGFATDLRGDGYSDTGIRRRLHVVKHFNRWLEGRKVALGRLDAEDIGRFLRHHLPRCGCPAPAPTDRGHCGSAIHRFVRYMRDQRLMRPPPQEAARSPIDELLKTYDCHLKEVCGLSLGTRENRRRCTRRFLHWRFGRQQIQLRHLRPKDVSGYVLECARHLAGTSVHPLCVDLRSFLRFLEFSQLRPGLAGSVPQLPQRAVPSLPGTLQPHERRRFLGSFPQSTPQGRRDYAIALCLSELALRSHEVADLVLEDLDWRALAVRLAQTKQRRQRLVPLPDRVARAILNYLKRGRPPTRSRALFVHHRTPRGRALAAHYVRRLVRRAFARCGIEASGTHVLRHTWATWAHRRGASLKLIADVLGHRSLDATTGYAHVNVEELRQVALPWPRSPR